MKTLTIEQLLKEYSCTEQDLADRVGLSVSMISKLKNGGVSVTDETQNRFFKAFQCEIMSPQLRIKRAYDDLLIKYIELQTKYDNQVRINTELKSKLNIIKGVLK